MSAFKHAPGNCCCALPCETTNNLPTGFMPTPLVIDFEYPDTSTGYVFGHGRIDFLQGSLGAQEISFALARRNGDVNTLRFYFESSVNPVWGDFSVGATVWHLKAELSGDSIPTPEVVCVHTFGTADNTDPNASMYVAFETAINESGRISTFVSGEFYVNSYWSQASTWKHMSGFDDIISVTISGATGSTNPASYLSQGTANIVIDNIPPVSYYDPSYCAPVRTREPNPCCLTMVGAASLPTTVPRVTVTGIVQHCDNDLIGQGNWSFTDIPLVNWPALPGAPNNVRGCSTNYESPVSILYSDAIPSKGIPSYPIAVKVTHGITVEVTFQRVLVGSGWVCVGDNSHEYYPQEQRDRWMATQIAVGVGLTTYLKFNSTSTNPAQQWDSKLFSGAGAGALIPSILMPIDNEVSLLSGWPLMASKSQLAHNSRGPANGIATYSNDGNCADPNLDYTITVQDFGPPFFQQTTFRFKNGGFNTLYPIVTVQL